MGGTVRFACLFDPTQHWRECAQLSSTPCSDAWADELRRKTLNHSTSFRSTTSVAYATAAALDTVGQSRQSGLHSERTYSYCHTDSAV